jgi:hypothetical protein
MRFPDGDITVNGALNINERIEGETVVSVTGRTGAFSNISGEVAIIPADDWSYSTLVFDVKHGKTSY